MLAYTLDKTYPNDFQLRAYYIRALGKLSKNRSGLTLQRCIKFYNAANLFGKCLAMRAIFGIDLTARRSTTGKHSVHVSGYSIHIKHILNSSITPLEKLSISLVLLSDYTFGPHHLSDSLDTFYREFLIKSITVSSETLVSISPKDDVDKSRLTKILEMAKENRFAAFVGLFSDFIETKGLNKEAKAVRELVTTDHLLYSNQDSHELHNLAVIFFRAGHLERAIEVAKFLTIKNAHQPDYYYLLLDLYRQDIKYKAEFERQKSKVLETFNLNDEYRQEFESIVIN